MLRRWTWLVIRARGLSGLESLLCRIAISVNVYGFYYGEVDAPVAQVDVPIRTTRFLTITPSYLYY